ncbi:hypothetical protein scyTo_0025579 [Scyliorhinus torazame]|uniref:Serine/threonine-protein kinase PLK1 n=1 Tax=Scyliorhinus torazame TaxID=75743 RepID=A0A401QHL8_SCYTO|nr:hypothetical protein [Scyliorhinus torazame]
MTTASGKPSAKLGTVAAPVAKEIPDILVNPKTMKKYMRGRFLGKGGFAKCYEISDVDTKEVFAGKIVPKTLLMKPHQREKMSMEISIHKSLNHSNVVGFHGFFEDDDFVYVVLELCRRRVSVRGWSCLSPGGLYLTPTPGRLTVLSGEAAGRKAPR